MSDFLWKISAIFTLSTAIIFLILVFLSFSAIYPQTAVFIDSIESVATNWILQEIWGFTTSKAFSEGNPLTTANSAGSYPANQNIYATMTYGVDLSIYKSAEIQFQYCPEGLASLTVFPEGITM